MENKPKKERLKLIGLQALKISGYNCNRWDFAKGLPCKLIDMKKPMWLARFFRSDSKESMMRLCTFSLIYGGIIFCYVHPAHYIAGIEMIGIGILGKGYQKGVEIKAKPKSQDDGGAR